MESSEALGDPAEDVPSKKFLPSLVLIKHPCLIRDGSEKKAIAMLGGVAQVEHTFNVGNMRMQLNFRTGEDSCSKGIFGSHRDIIGVWAVVRRYRNRRTGQVICRSEPIGVVRHVYEFDGMADFQFLPACKLSSSKPAGSSSSNKEGKTSKERVNIERVNDNFRPPGNSLSKDMREALVDVDVENVEFDSFVKSNSGPLFIVPQVFTRMDMPYAGVYKHVTETRLQRRDEAGLPVLRKQRTNYATIVRLLAPPFGDPVPEKALPEALELFMLVDESLRLRVAEAFERRPVWTKSALSYELDLDRIHLKTVIVGLAYCVSQGPYRLCWIRYGFDPRSDSSAKQFQTLDFRVKASTAVREPGRLPDSASGSWDAPAVRGGHVVPVQIAPSGHRHKRNRHEDTEVREMLERQGRMLRCRYVSGFLPQSRQLLYHLCDIGLDNVQELIHRNDSSEQWSDQDGWCLPGTIGHIRDYLAADLKRTVERRKQESSSGEGGFPHEEEMQIGYPYDVEGDLGDEEDE